jgi:transportin-3
MYDLVQLDESARLSLKDSLMAILQQNKAGSPALVTQICLSIAALAIQLPQWKNTYQQFVQLFANDPQGANCLLEFLTVLPEEINSNSKIPISVRSPISL